MPKEAKNARVARTELEGALSCINTNVRSDETGMSFYKAPKIFSVDQNKQQV